MLSDLYLEETLHILQGSFRREILNLQTFHSQPHTVGGKVLKTLYPTKKPF